MTSRPILMSGPMVRAILDGRKTVTRRVVKLPTGMEFDGFTSSSDGPVVLASKPNESTGARKIRSRFGGSNVELWVKETFCDVTPLPQEKLQHKDDRIVDGPSGKRVEIWYRANVEPDPHIGPDKPHWKSPIYMPRWASRLTLRVTSVRVERLRDITSSDVAAEGTPRVADDPDGYPCLSCDFGIGKSLPADSAGCVDCCNTGVAPRQHFAMLWDSLNGKAPWASNPWVWRVAFEVKS